MSDEQSDIYITRHILIRVTFDANNLFTLWPITPLRNIEHYDKLYILMNPYDQKQDAMLFNLIGVGGRVKTQPAPVYI